MKAICFPPTFGTSLQDMRGVYCGKRRSNLGQDEGNVSVTQKTIAEFQRLSILLHRARFEVRLRLELPR
jgi:hypothetical protein